MVLVVEDDDNLRNLICYIVRSMGYVCETANNLKNGLERLIELKPTVLLADIRLPEGNDSIPIIKVCQRILPDTKIVIMSGVVKEELQSIIDKLNIKHVIYKPFILTDIEIALQNA